MMRLAGMRSSMAKDKNKNPGDARGWTNWPEDGQFARREDVSCAELPAFKAKYNQGWGLQDEEGDQDLPGNELNNPVDEKKGDDYPANGWLEVASDIETTAGKGRGNGTGEQR
jgi:hypothetical protein